MAADVENVENDPFEKALSDSLRDFAHITQLKVEQKHCLRSLVEKKDVFGILPTGFGKSIIFQILPRVIKVLWHLERTTVLVVTPLVSIMKDQVEEMRELGLKAYAIGLGDEETEKELRASADVEIIYGSPESWCSPVWSRELQDGQLGKQIVCIVVDEAHAVTAWGEVSVRSKGKKKSKEPFREAFARVKDLRSQLPGVPLLALTASVKVKDRPSLWKACGMVNPVIVDVAPNKENICIEFNLIAMEREALKSLKWVASMIEKEKKETPQTIIFCKTFNDIANVVSYLLMNLREDAFYDKDGKKVPLIGVYHAKSWESEKNRTEEDFKESGIQRVVVATCALGMGINFPHVEYVVHFGPPQTVTEVIQQAGRAGRKGQQAYSIVYATNRQLSQCDKDVKEILKTQNCMRIALYQHFQDTPMSKEPGHLCCTVCRKSCKCSGEDCVVGDVHHLSADQDDTPSDNNINTRKLSEIDKNDLHIALNELKDKYSAGVVSLFHEETCHGFTESLVDDIVHHAEYIFSGKYLTDNLAIYSTVHAIDVLETFQELFDDIDDFEQEMDQLHLLKKHFTDIENYLIASTMSGETVDFGVDDLEGPLYNLDF